MARQDRVGTDWTRPDAPAAPLWAVQSLVFLVSLGSGVVTNGIFFVAKEGFGFTASMNFGLGVMLGVTYILGAVGVGPARRHMAARYSSVSTRGVLVGLSILMGLAASLPQAAVLAAGGAAGVSWSVWVAVAIYSPCSGAFWPIVESYLGGGRSGKGLRRAVGQFNTIWAIAVLVALWAMGPVLARYPLGMPMVFGCVQILSTVLAWPLGPEPGVHIAEHHEPHPPVYVALLTTFRVLLPTSYYVLNVWAPYAPSMMERLGVAVAWQTPVAATWMVSRLFVFATMERWHGWHGRWWLVAVGVVGMVGGIGIALAAPILGPGLGLPVLIGGLAVLGVGSGVTYFAALYYAMEVGKGEVEAGGTHEALIGVGFAGGPMTGLVAVGAVGSGLLGGMSLNVAVLAVLGGVLAVIGVLVAGRVWQAARAAGRAGAGPDPDGSPRG